MKILIATLLYIVTIAAFAAFPVVPVPSEEHERLLKSESPKLAANKRIAYDIYRVVMAAQLDQLEKYVSKDLINHNPNEASGFDGLKEYIRQNWVASQDRCKTASMAWSLYLLKETWLSWPLSENTTIRINLEKNILLPGLICFASSMV